MDDDEACSFPHLNQPDWSRVEALAIRLGVRPLKAGQSSPIVFHIHETGNDYDAAEILHAVLDRIEAATKKPEPFF